MDVPGLKPPTFGGWLKQTDLDPGPGEMKRLLGEQFDNTAHEAYAALGTTLGLSLNNATLTFLTIVTEGQQPTTVRVLGGEAASDLSEYGYRDPNTTPSFLGATTYHFHEDKVGTFSAVPEASTVLVWLCLSLFAVCSGAVSTWQKRIRKTP
jgi:hypothetical protein